MARRTKAEAEETRQRILDAAERLFFVDGVSRTSLELIANAAGVTRGAIYWHFKNKVELFEALHERVKLPAEDIVERAMAGDHDAFSELARISIGRLYVVARLILRDEAKAEDATQEALVAAWRHIHGLRDPDRFEAWLAA